MKNPEAKRYWCSSPKVTGEVVVLHDVVYMVPRAWFRWRGKRFDEFRRACKVDRYEEMKEGGDGTP